MVTFREGTADSFVHIFNVEMSDIFWQTYLKQG